MNQPKPILWTIYSFFFTGKSRDLLADLCVCKAGYFESGVKECTTCSKLCGSCLLDPYSCLSCNSATDFRYLNDYSKCVCNDGYYDKSVYDELTGLATTEVPICEECINNCKTCSSNLPNSCLSCFIDRNFVLST